MIDAQGNYVPDVTPVTTTNNPATSVTAPVTSSTIPIPTPTQIYSASNIAQATNAPVAPPDLSNASAIYDYYLGGKDVTDARTQAEADATALATAKATARNRQIAIERNPLESQQFIVGEQARAGQLDTATLNALADTAGVSSAIYASAKQTASEKANIALSQRSELVNMINQNPKAGITFNDTVVSASKKVSDYMDKVAKDIQDKADKEYTQNLKSTLMQLGINTKGLGTKGMEKKLTASYKSKADAQKVLDDLKLRGIRADLGRGMRADLGNGGKVSDLQAVADEFKKTGGDWGKTATNLANKGYNVSSGSAIDNELRRRNNLAPIGTGKGAATAIKQIGDWVYFSDGTRENQTTGEVQQQQ